MQATLPMELTFTSRTIYIELTRQKSFGKKKPDVANFQSLFLSYAIHDNQRLVKKFVITLLHTIVHVFV